MHARTPDAGPGTTPRPGAGRPTAGLEQAGGRPGTTPPVPGRWSFSGLAFPLALLAVLVALTVQVVADAGPLLPLDEAVRDGMRDLTDAATWLDGPMHLLADLGGPLPAGLVLTAAFAFACVRAARRTASKAVAVRLAAVTALTVAAVSAAVLVGKMVIARPGPGGGEITGGEWGFFPSGHTATSAVCYGTAALLLGTVLSPGNRRRAHAVTILLCGLIGFALLWCDYHWLGDVLASWALCGIALWAAARYLPRDTGRPTARDATDSADPADG